MPPIARGGEDVGGGAIAAAGVLGGGGWVAWTADAFEVCDQGE